MALMELKTNVDYVKWTEVASGTTIKGFYKESKPSVKFPDNLNHYIETAEGKIYGLNGASNLDRAMEQFKLGWWIEITYEDCIILENGQRKGSKCHQFKFKYDPERVHPLYGGDSSALNQVEYKNSADKEQGQSDESTEQDSDSKQDSNPKQDVTPRQDSTPALVKPSSDPPASSQPAKPATKRSVF